LIISKLLK